MKIYVVNGHESRLPGFLQACKSLNLEVEIVKSYKLDDPELLEKGKKHINITCAISMISSTMTHMKCMQKIVESNENFGLIVEDDVRFHKQFNQLVDSCCSYMRHKAGSVDILSMGFVNFPYSESIINYDGIDIIENVSLGNPWGTQCYMITKEYAEKFLELFSEDFYTNYKKAFSPDWVIFDPIIGCRRATLALPIVIESEFEQPNGQSNKPNLFNILNKDDYYYYPINYNPEIMNIAFWDNALCERGTTVSLYDYAFFNQKILNNKSYIFYDKNSKNNKDEVIEKFKKQFVVHKTNNFNEVDFFLEKYNITHIYIIVSGENDSKLSNIAKNCIHCVFNCYKPHGQVYSAISEGVHGNNGKYPIVPHMVNLPRHARNMRNKLNIPQNAVVFGGYGGSDSFDISYVHTAVYNVARQNPNIYFLFANFNKFCEDLPNIIHLPMITDLDEKVEFINTCDAKLWARERGESFGLAIAEFSTLNKPVIATKYSKEDFAHVYLLKDKAIWYDNENHLMEILLKFNPENESKKDWNAYEEYTPEKVMKIFKQVFLD